MDARYLKRIAEAAIAGGNPFVDLFISSNERKPIMALSMAKDGSTVRMLAMPCPRRLTDLPTLHPYARVTPEIEPDPIAIRFAGVLAEVNRPDVEPTDTDVEPTYTRTLEL